MWIHGQTWVIFLALLDLLTKLLQKIQTYNVTIIKKTYYNYTKQTFDMTQSHQFDCCHFLPKCPWTMGQAFLPLQLCHQEWKTSGHDSQLDNAVSHLMLEWDIITNRIHMVSLDWSRTPGSEIWSEGEKSLKEWGQTNTRSPAHTGCTYSGASLQLYLIPWSSSFCKLFKDGLEQFVLKRREIENSR